MASTHGQRKITDEHEARKCLAEALAAGEAVGRWARAHGIDGRSLNAWRMNLGRRHPRTARRRPRGAGAQVLEPRRGLVELVPAPAVRTPTAGRYVLQVGELRLEFGEDVDANTLRRVVEVLRTC